MCVCVCVYVRVCICNWHIYHIISLILYHNQILLSQLRFLTRHKVVTKTAVITIVKRLLWWINATRNYFGIVVPLYQWRSAIKLVCISLINRSHIVNCHFGCNYGAATLQLTSKLCSTIVYVSETYDNWFLIRPKAQPGLTKFYWKR